MSLRDKRFKLLRVRVSLTGEVYNTIGSPHRGSISTISNSSKQAIIVLKRFSRTERASSHTHEGTGVHSAQGTVLGHNGLRYQVDLNWAKANPKVAPVINSHALAEGWEGLVNVVTDHPKITHCASDPLNLQSGLDS